MVSIPFKDIVISFLMAGLFLIAIVNFGTLTAKNYGFNESIMDVPGLDINVIDSNLLNTSEDESEGWERAYLNQTNPFPKENQDVSFLSLTEFWKIVKSMWSSLKSIANFALDSSSTILGIPKIALSVLITILIILMMFSLWRLIRIGG